MLDFYFVVNGLKEINESTKCKCMDIEFKLILRTTC
jgi:hypothetical protein